MKHVAEFIVVAGAAVLLIAWLLNVLPIFLDGHWIVAGLLTGAIGWAMSAVLDIGEKLTPKSKRDPQDDP